MGKPMRDWNGHILRRCVRRDANGTWSANVWSTHPFEGTPIGAHKRRYHGYASRRAARAASVSALPDGGWIGDYWEPGGEEDEPEAKKSPFRYSPVIAMTDELEKDLKEDQS